MGLFNFIRQHLVAFLWISLITLIADQTMKHLQEIYTALNLDKKLIELANGQISIPYLDNYRQPDEYWYPHPPVLIPLFLGYGASYYGISQHFFGERKTTFVEYAIEWGYMLEFARTPNQIYSQMVLDMNMLAEGLDDQILAFCAEIDFKKFKDVDSFAYQYGNIMEDYDKLIHLQEGTPLTYIKALKNYKGDYPSSEKLFNADQLQACCSFEIANPQFLEERTDLPEWLKPLVPQRELFNTYIENKDLKSAWLTLNSTGWSLADVAEGLTVLKSMTDNPLFQLVADNWIAGWSNSEFKTGSL